ncbi:hypothetical protein, partial [Streptococcus pseudopneumoniae]|uniref:hypothetical protein n=1 Tax=Streptococcus pseudopneumoniae TaxID=257758 RepID=UPI001BB20603
VEGRETILREGRKDPLVCWCFCLLDLLVRRERDRIPPHLNLINLHPFQWGSDGKAILEKRKRS